MRLHKSVVEYRVNMVGSLPVVVSHFIAIASHILSTLSSSGVPGEGEYLSGFGREEVDGLSKIGNRGTTIAAEQGKTTFGLILKHQRLSCRYVKII